VAISLNNKTVKRASLETAKAVALVAKHPRAKRKNPNLKRRKITFMKKRKRLI